MGTKMVYCLVILGTMVVFACSSGKTSKGTDGPGTDDTDTGIDWTTVDPTIEGDYEPGAKMGPQTEKEYTPEGENSNGVVTDPAGRLILSSTESGFRNHLWVSNSKEGTVSNVDTEKLIEVGRYHSGTGDAADPSRTSVDLAGDVFVGNRGESSVTKISGDLERCIDRNNNGVIDTSSGPTDVYPRAAQGDPNVPAGQSTDECVVWTHVINESIPCEGPRGVAATAETGTDFEFNGHVWIGCRDTNTIFKLNGNTGEVMEALGPYDGSNGQNVSPYGFVLDKNGRLWISGKNGEPGLYWLDTNTKEIHAAVGSSGEAPGEPYGIALDDNGHIWISTMKDGAVCRFSPGPNINPGTWECLQVTDGFRGIAVDIDGYVWAIDTDGQSEVYMLDPKAFPAASSVHGPYYFGKSDVNAEKGTGIAIDFSGHVWGISTTGCITEAGDMGCASRLTVDRSGGGLPSVASDPDVVPVGEGPYVYSDMIGYNLRNFTSKEGWYRQIFDVCDDASTKWIDIAFNSDTPKGTRFVIRARTADQIADLDDQPWITVVEVPDDKSPKVLPANLPQGHFIELEVRLYTEENGITPAVGQIGFSYECTYDVDVILV